MDSLKYITQKCEECLCLRFHMDCVTAEITPYCEVIESGEIEEMINEIPEWCEIKKECIDDKISK